MLLPLQRTVPALQAADAVQAPAAQACGHCEVTYQLPCESQVSTAGAPEVVQRRWPAVHCGTRQVVPGAEQVWPAEHAMGSDQSVQPEASVTQVCC
jgi:hypothetical protein